jgi:hypothetical protein
MPHKINVGFLQLNSVFADQHYLPLSVGMLVAYAEKYAQEKKFLHFQTPVCDYGDPSEIAKQFDGCDVLSASMYVWNEQSTLAICEEYKRRNPAGIVIIGGPSVPNGQKQFRRKKTKELTDQERSAERFRFTEDYHLRYKFIDFLVHGEGERVFCQLLDSFCRQDSAWRTIPSLSYINNEEFTFNPLIERMTDEELSACPSPFQSGYFDRTVAKFPERKWIVMYETDRGCPYQCSYCDWGGATEDKVSKFALDQIYEDIMWMGRNKIPYVFLCNANFGILRRDIEIAEFFVKCKTDFGYLEGVSTQNAKNPKPHTLDALRVLDSAGLNKATVMSQQSLNTDTLKAVRRDNMDLAEYDQMQKKLAMEGIYTMTDIIFPMPQETYESLTSSVSTLISRGQYNRIQFNNLSILINTEMGNPEYQKKYEMRLVRSAMINVHGRRESTATRLMEYQTLVVGTNTMPPSEWLRARVYCWLVNFVFFNKLLQMPIIFLNQYYGIDYAKIFEVFVDIDSRKYPIVGSIIESFWRKADEIQNGNGEEYEHSERFLNIYWPPDELAHIELCTSERMPTFFAEVLDLWREHFYKPGFELIDEALGISNSLVRLPFETKDKVLKLKNNIPRYVKNVMKGEISPLEHGDFDLIVKREGTQMKNLDDWCQYVVWYGNRRGSYIYEFDIVAERLAELKTT